MPGFDEGVGTGRSSGLIRVRFEIDVEGSAARFHASLFERENLGVLYAVIGMRAASQNIAVGVGNDRSNVWIGRSEADALAG